MAMLGKVLGSMLFYFFFFCVLILDISGTDFSLRIENFPNIFIYEASVS